MSCLLDGTSTQTDAVAVAGGVATTVATVVVCSESMSAVHPKVLKQSQRTAVVEDTTSVSVVVTDCVSVAVCVLVTVFVTVAC